MSHQLCTNDFSNDIYLMRSNSSLYQQVSTLNYFPCPMHLIDAYAGITVYNYENSWSYSVVKVLLQAHSPCPHSRLWWHTVPPSLQHTPQYGHHRDHGRCVRKGGTGRWQPLAWTDNLENYQIKRIQFEWTCVKLDPPIKVNFRNWISCVRLDHALQRIAKKFFLLSHRNTKDFLAFSSPEVRSPK